MRTLFKLMYRLRLRRPYQLIDRLHYLKRLRRGTAHKNDEWVYCRRDINQFTANEEILISSTFRDTKVFFICDPSSHVERHIIRYGLYGSYVLDIISTFLVPDTTVIDVGANVGAYSIPLAKAFPSIEVHAFEPHPEAVKRFKRNLSMNRLENVYLYESGVGAASETRPFYGFDVKDMGLSTFMQPNVDAGIYNTFTINVKALDDLYSGQGRKVSLLKIDVEGYERQVLKGARQLIMRDRPFIVLEHEDDHFDNREQANEAKRNLQEFFSEANYSVFYITQYDADMLFPVKWNRPLDGNLLAIPGR